VSGEAGVLRGIWAAVALAVLTAVCSLWVLVLAALGRRGDPLLRAGKLWSRAMLRVVGARVTYHGLEHARAPGPHLFVANHQSFVDIWALTVALPDSARYVAKAELFRIPIFGWAMAAAGFIPIARSQRAKAIASLDRAAAHVRSGLSIVLFPEGTRSLDGRLLPFKKGAFHLALAAGAPIVPVAIRGSFAILPPRSLRVRPGPVEVHFEPPVDVAPFLPSDHEGLLSLVHRTIARRLDSPLSDGRDVPQPARSC
jgi:1-acyl-sn-glycerol-3-phosphate acyltransferase